jgi:hypothetical protein
MIEQKQILDQLDFAVMEAEIALLCARLQALIGGSNDDQQYIQECQEQCRKYRDAAAQSGLTLRLDRYTSTFSLCAFERQLLLLTAGADLNEALANLILQAQAGESSWPALGLALRLFCNGTQELAAARECLRADAPLFRFQLLECINTQAPLHRRFVRSDSRIADALVGSDLPDPRLSSFLRIYLTRDLVANPADGSVARVAGCLREHLFSPGSNCLIVHLHGAPIDDLEIFADAVGQQLRLPLASVLQSPIELDRYLVRESLLLPCLLLLHAELDGSGKHWPALLAHGPRAAFLASRHEQRRPEGVDAANWLSVSVEQPTCSQRAQLWRNVLDTLQVREPAAPELLAEGFIFSETEIRRAARIAGNSAWLKREPATAGHIFAACRAESEHRMNELAEHIHSCFIWQDLLLPSDTLAKLHELSGQVKSRARVLEEFGFGPKLSRGRGITALFCGASGTGKTMAAEVIAGELGRELYRVDLARVVSKYVGETEKNLRDIFHEAERASCVVLFDEADALFGRRTEVRDSHDRYANIEVSYLLQLLEQAENAVVLLATNRRDAIDEAFLRRFRLIVDFPMPDVPTRRQLWQTSFPQQLRVSALDFDKLAERLSLSGASIKNIALAAAHLAACDGGVVVPSYVARAIRRELEKLGRPATMSEAEITLPASGGRI